MGAPMREAILDTLHDMPRRVPSRERSGVMLANAADGTVTRAAEKKPRGQEVNKHPSIPGEEGRLTPQYRECNEGALSLDTDPAQRKDPARKRTQYPRQDRPQEMRYCAADKPSEETARDAKDENVQRQAIRGSQSFARVRRDIEVRDNISQEREERRGSKDEEQLVMQRRFVEELARFTPRRKHRRAREQCGNRKHRRDQRNESKRANRPGESHALCKSIEHDDVNHASDGNARHDNAQRKRPLLQKPDADERQTGDV